MTDMTSDTRAVSPLSRFLQTRAAGESVAWYSCCSASDDVLKAAMMRARTTGSVLLIEATANQVNQEGGYSGMTPEGFRLHVLELATDCGLDTGRLVFGGDHLGPLTWTHLTETEAMDRAARLVRSFVLAGYQKIHLDTSMKLADDPEGPLAVEVCARRGAFLCSVCQQAFAEYAVAHPNADAPVYVIGSEVPVPGGETSDASSAISTKIDVQRTLQAYRTAFHDAGLDTAFERIAALVVQTGAEFSEFSTSDFSAADFQETSECFLGKPLGFEAHSTDYQTRENLRAMRVCGASFLKVGPALTYAARSALFKLELIEKELCTPSTCSDYRGHLEAAMLERPQKWMSYYTGSVAQQAFARAFSYSDRSRYYLADERVATAKMHLLDNLGQVDLPSCILSELFPQQYRRIRRGILEKTADAIFMDAIGDVVDDYLFATDDNRTV